MATRLAFSYALDEMREISAGMDADTAEVEAAMRSDFWPIPADARNRMMELLGASGCETRAWREGLLGVPNADPRRAVS